MAKSTSLRRQIKRGKAIIVFDNVVKQNKVVFKKGTPRSIWAWSVKNKNTEEQDRQNALITMPILQSDILKSTKNHIFKY